MSDPFVGEIRLFAGKFVPKGWQACDGTLLSCPDFTNLFFMIGTIYGGDGVNSFAVPDLRGRVPLGVGPSPSTNGLNYAIGNAAGSSTAVISEPSMPSHSHSYSVVDSPASMSEPSGAAYANVASPASNMVTVSGNSVGVEFGLAALSPAGSGEPHENRMPSMAITYIIATNGILPD